MGKPRRPVRQTISRRESSQRSLSQRSLLSSYLPHMDHQTMFLFIVFWATVLLYTDSTILQMVSFWPTSPAVELRPPGELRLDWSSLKPQSPVAKLLTAERHNCSRPLKYHKFAEVGLGAELHAYTFSLCLAHKHKRRLYSRNFMYYDREACSGHSNTVSMLNCYFNTLELPCPNDEAMAKKQQNHPRLEQLYKLDYWNLWGTPKEKETISVCQSIQGLPSSPNYINNVEMRSAALEALFTAGISPVIINEAKRQHALVFPHGAPESAQLITVHIRWGDKRKEMQLVPIQEYINAIENIVAQQQLDQVHVYLATEDPSAVYAFQQAIVGKGWNLYLDQFYKEQLPFRNNLTQDVAKNHAANRNGHTGLLALGSLLVAMEANHFVLTSASNWSRLMNELRRNIIRVHDCPGVDCTSVVDLRKATFWMDLDQEGNGV